MKPTLSILFLLSTVLLSAQTSEIHITHDPPSVEYGDPMEDSLYFNLPMIENSQHIIHIRIDLGLQLVDIYSEDSINYLGIITNTIQQSDSRIGWFERIEFENQVYQYVELDSGIANEIANRIFSTRIDTFPTSGEIESWSNLWIHAKRIGYQFKIGDRYSQSSYYAFQNQADTVPYASTLVENYVFIRDTLELDTAYQKFIDLLPVGYYYTMNGYRSLYKYTPKETEAWLAGAPRRNYLRANKARIDSTIQMQLDTMNIPTPECSCFTDFMIYFDKDGKMKSIEVIYYDRPSFLEEPIEYFIKWREIKYCRRLIKPVFQKIDIGQIDYEFSRTVNFNNDGILSFTNSEVY